MHDDRTPRRPTIRNAVIHLQGEQPLMADLFETPQPSDLGLLCTNLRMLNGKRPVFADHIHSTFFFPYHFVRFVEMLPAPSDLPAVLEAEPAQPFDDEPEGEIEIDEDFLRRIREV